MKASLRWLRELCPQLPDDAAAVASRLTGAGLEVEATHAIGAGTEKCVVARVVAVRPHPSRDGLRLVRVERGGGEQEVVCGAPNVPAPGGLVVLAPLGTHLPAKGMTIEPRKIAGVLSEGMLCSEAELGLGDDGGGILVLPPDLAAPGTPLTAAVPGARDTVLEIGLTPNRPDGLGHVGLAREAAALFGVPFGLVGPGFAARAAGASGAAAALQTLPVAMAIEDGERCPHYGAVAVDGVRIGPSPLDVRWRLAALGVRPISNIVDVTNLVMLELGHPMHAFDLARVRGARIVVRRARPGERLRTLDGVDRALDADDLVICDGDGPVALAGVMGGGESEIAASTTCVLFECAYFDARGVRRTARRHGLHTESSHRFERGVDWGDTRAVLARATALAVQLAGGAATGPAHVVEARPLSRARVTLAHDRVAAVLGFDVGRDPVRAILGRLGFERHPAGEGADEWVVPSFRPDVSRPIDLVEEVARVHGFDAIPSALPAIRPSRDAAPRAGLARRARAAGVAMGLSEAIGVAFASRRDLEAVGAPAPGVVLRNPMSEEQAVMRSSLLPGLLRAVQRARRHGEGDARLFSVGALFLGSSDVLPEERLSFAAVLAGTRPAWLTKPAPFDVWDAKGLAEGIVERMVRRTAALRPATADRPLSHLHPRGASWIEVDGAVVGSLGPIHPDVADAFELGDGAVMVVQLDLAGLDALGARPVRFSPLPRFPASTRDLALVVRDGVPAGDVERAAREAAGEFAEHVALFDRFVGGAVPAGHASLGVRIVYRAPDRTLTDAEVDARHAAVIAAVHERFGATLRG